MRVLKSLQDVVKANDKIKEVYFDKEGNHYFRKHDAIIHKDNGHGLSVGSKKVECLGVTDNILKIKQPNGIEIDKKVHTAYKEIAETMTREQVLGANAVLPVLSDKEENEILEKAAEIYRKRGVVDMVKKQEVKKQEVKKQ